MLKGRFIKSEADYQLPSEYGPLKKDIDDFFAGLNENYHGKKLEPKWYDDPYDHFIALQVGSLGFDEAAKIYYWLHSVFPDISSKLEVDLHADTIENIVGRIHAKRKKAQTRAKRKKTSSQHQIREKVRVSDKDRTHLLQQLNEKRASIEIEESPTPNLELPEEITDPQEIESNWLSPRNFSAIPLVGRDDEIEILNHFLTFRKISFQILPIVAPSGAGKTRLVLEWLHRHAKISTWDKGFVQDRDPKPWADWKPRRNTLIIIDYIFHYNKTIGAIIDAATKFSDYTIRLVLVDHTLPKPEEYFDHAVYHHIANDREQLETRRKLLFRENGLVLEPLGYDPENSSNLNGTLAKIIRHRAGDEIDKATLRAALESLARMGEAARHPLFAALMGDAIQNNVEDVFTLDRRQLIEYYLDKTNRLPWKHLGGEPETVSWSGRNGCWPGALISAATARRGLPFVDMVQCLPGDPEKNDYIGKTASTRKTLADYCHHVVSSSDKETLTPLEPDIIGESFFLLFLNEFQFEQTVIERFFRMLECGFNKPDEQRPAFVAFIIRLTRNLLNEPADAVPNANPWQLLAHLLDPGHYRKEYLVRHVIVEALGYVCAQLASAGEKEKARSFADLIDPGDLVALSEADPVAAFRCVSVIFDQFQEFNCPFPDRLDKPLETILDAFDSLEAFPPSSLSFAAFLDLPNIIALQIGRGKNVEEADKISGAFPLLIASENGNFKSVTALLNADAKVNQVHEKNGIFPLLMAAQEGHEGVVAALLNADADVNQVHEEEGAFPLLQSAQNGHEKVVTALLNADADVNQVNEKNGTFPLLMAAQAGHEKVVTALLNAGAQVNQVHEKEGAFPLLQSAQNGHEKVVTALLKADAKVNQVNEKEGAFPLLMAAQAGHEKVVTALLKADAKVNQVHEKEGTFPLLMAAQNGHEKVVTALLNAGAQVNQVNEKNEGRSALIVACNAQQFSCVQLLLNKNDINPNQPMNNGYTALIFAGGHGNLAIVTLLTGDERVDVDKTENNGATALFFAATFDHQEVVGKLLEEGADPTIKAKDGSTAADDARSEGHEETAQMLEEAANDWQEGDHNSSSSSGDAS